MENVTLQSILSKMEWLPKFSRSDKIGMAFAGIIKLKAGMDFVYIYPSQK